MLGPASVDNINAGSTSMTYRGDQAGVAWTKCTGSRLCFLVVCVSCGSLELGRAIHSFVSPGPHTYPSYCTSKTELDLTVCLSSTPYCELHESKVFPCLLYYFLHTFSYSTWDVSRPSVNVQMNEYF